MLDEESLIIKEPIHKQKIAFFDIETAPSLGYYFELYKEGNIISTKENWYILSFAWKWLGETKTHVVALPDFKLFKKDRTDDSEVVKALWNLFNEAEILIAHHGDSFDIKKANARFIQLGLEPPTPYTTIDTRKVARRYFKFDSNKLNDLGQYLKVGRKLKHTGTDLWLDCMAGDLKAWKLMKDYNKQDVVLLEKIYLKMRGWIKNHPNMNMYNGTYFNCPNCGSPHLHKRGFLLTRTRAYQRYKCANCNAWSKGEVEKLGSKIIN